MTRNLAWNKGWYTEHNTLYVTFVVGGETAYGTSIGFAAFANAAVWLPSDFLGTILLQASADGQEWASCVGSAGGTIQVGTRQAGRWVTLDAAIVPHRWLRWIRVDARGQPSAGDVAYRGRMVLKT